MNAVENDVLLVEDTGHVRVITLNRPGRKNAFDGALTRAFDQALTELDEEPELWVGIVYGGTEVFSAGADLKAVMSGDIPVLDGKGFGGFAKRSHAKPLIAAVEGPALGGGTELALFCDLVVAAEDALLGLPEIKRGILAGGGGLLRLGQALPKATAMEIALLGEPIAPHRALELGLINRVAAKGQALAVAQELAAALCRNAPVALREARGLLELAQSADDDEVWAATTVAGKLVSASEDAKEGPRAFLEKRTPVWTGR
jgi:enoyl-CoA hydratase